MQLRIFSSTVLKSYTYTRFYNEVYEPLPHEIKDQLTRLYPNLTESILLECVRGTFCMKIIGSIILDTYNKWAKLKGKSIYDWRTMYNEI